MERGVGVGVLCSWGRGRRGEGKTSQLWIVETWRKSKLKRFGGVLIKSLEKAQMRFRTERGMGVFKSE